MSHSNDQGYDRILANYESLVNHCIGFGSVYNPGNPLIQVASMQSALTSTLAVFQNVITAHTAHANMVNARAIEFAKLPSFATRVVNALAASGAHQQTMDDARAVLRKIRGGRASAKSRPAPLTVPVGEEPVNTETHRTISVSQKSYDSLAAHIVGLIEIVRTAPSYNPLEPELTVAGLDAYLENLRTLNTNVNLAMVTYENARIQRNQTLNQAASGIINIGKMAKSYVKSVFGARSMQYLQVSKLRF